MPSRWDTINLYLRLNAVLLEGAIMKLAIAAAFLAAVPVFADQPAANDSDLAQQVMKASGADTWSKVKRIKFTFHVESDGQTKLDAKHDWDVKASTDTVTWGGKTVKINLNDANNEGDAKAAFQRWTNDTYWLLAPIKIKDKGCNCKDDAEKEMNGQKYQVLHLNFDKVGLTPGDQYNLYIDPKTHLVRYFDYMPTPDKKITATWDGYKDFNGLMISTEHVMGDNKILLNDISVEVK
jgi:hypothetical protein